MSEKNRRLRANGKIKLFTNEHANALLAMPNNGGWEDLDLLEAEKLDSNAAGNNGDPQDPEDGKKQSKKGSRKGSITGE